MLINRLSISISENTNEVQVMKYSSFILFFVLNRLIFLIEKATTLKQDPDFLHAIQKNHEMSFNLINDYHITVTKNAND